MATSTETQSPEQSNLTEDWTVVLPRRGKKSRSFRKPLIPEKQKDKQAWAPMDVETDPERESRLKQKMEIYTQKLATSEFCNAFFDQMQSPDMLDGCLKILGSEKQMNMVIYGIGSIETFDPPRMQLSLAILMKQKFNWIGEVEVFDPIISLAESNVLSSLGCTVLAVNEQGRRLALKPTMFFMPHCEAELYDNLLEANWRVDQLSNLLLFGNSFSAYEQHASVFPRSDVTNSRKHILAARAFTEEFHISTPSDESFRAFHGSSWHLFNPGSNAELNL